MSLVAKFIADFTEWKTSVAGAEADVRRLTTGTATEMKTFDASVKSTTSSFSDMRSVVGSMAGAFGIALSVGAVVQFGRSVLDAGDQIQKMAGQTGLGTDEVQKLQHIAGQSGTSVEALVGAVQNLQQRIGDDDSGAAGAMKKLGIHADEFNKLDTYTQMTTLGEAIRNIQDPTEQASVAAALFGKTWKEILPAIKSGMKDVGDQASIMSEQTVKELARLEAGFKSFTERSKAETGSWAVWLMDHFSVVDDSAKGFKEQLAQMEKTATAALPKVATSLQGVEMSAVALKHVEDELTAGTKDAIAANQELAKAKEALYAKVQKLEGDYTAVTLEGFDKVNQASARANATRFAETTAGYASLSRAEAALADDIAKSTLKSSDYQMLKIREVADAQIASFPPMLAFREQYVAAVEALAARQAATVIAQAEREVAAATAAANALLTIVVGTGPTAPFGGAGGGFNPSGGLHPLSGLSNIFTAPTVFDKPGLSLTGFASGGPVMRDGPIYAHAGEYVTPAGGGVGMNVSITINGSVLGNKDEIARVVGEALMKVDRQRNKRGVN